MSMFCGLTSLCSILLLWRKWRAERTSQATERTLPSGRVRRRLLEEEEDLVRECWKE